MKIPQDIEKALNDRLRAIYDFQFADLIITQFIEEHNINVNREDLFGGAEAILNPDESINRIREAINKG